MIQETDALYDCLEYFIESALKKHNYKERKLPNGKTAKFVYLSHRLLKHLKIKKYETARLQECFAQRNTNARLSVVKSVGKSYDGGLYYLSGTQLATYFALTPLIVSAIVYLDRVTRGDMFIVQDLEV